MLILQFSVSCVQFLSSYCVVGAQCCLCRVVGAQCCLCRVVGAQCCLCRVCGFCRLTVWSVPNVFCVVCVVFVVLLCGGCPMLSVSCVQFLSSYCVMGAQCCLCRVCSFCLLTVWWVPNVVCVVCVVFVVLLCGGCPMLSVSCVQFLSSYCVVGAQCCLCRVCSFCRLTVWWVPNVVCVVCVVFVVLLCGGCPMLSVSCVQFLSSYCVVGAQCFLCRVCSFCRLAVWWVPNVVCVVCVVFVVLLCGGCPMLSVSCVQFLSSCCVVGAQCCLCRVCSFCRLAVWWVPNVVCVVCVVFVVLLCGGCPMLSVSCGGCPMLSVSCVWFLSSYCVVGVQCCLCPWIDCPFLIAPSVFSRVYSIN